MSGNSGKQNSYKTALLRVCLHVMEKRDQLLANHPTATAAMLQEVLPSLKACKRAATDAMLEAEKNPNKKKKDKKDKKSKIKKPKRVSK